MDKEGKGKGTGKKIFQPLWHWCFGHVKDHEAKVGEVQIREANRDL